MSNYGRTSLRIVGKHNCGSGFTGNVVRKDAGGVTVIFCQLCGKRFPYKKVVKQKW